MVSDQAMWVVQNLWSNWS